MSETDRQEREDEAYLTGNRAALASMLLECLRRLGYDDPAAMQARWANEREEAILALRSVCSKWGDLEWDAQLHLADIINKHLRDHLEAPRPGRTTKETMT